MSLRSSSLVWLAGVVAALADSSLPSIGLTPAPAEPGALQVVIEQLFGQRVRDHRGEANEALEAAARHALQGINREGITSRRVNEVGNAVEPFVIHALIAHGFSASIPVTRSGRRRSTGYPDIAAQRGEDRFYIEVKTYHPSNENTTQRSFYLSPSGDPKVTEPAFHLLIAFAMERSETGRYFAKSVRLLDLFDLPLNLKYEFNASNRDLYGQDSGLEVIAENHVHSP